MRCGALRREAGCRAGAEFGEKLRPAPTDPGPATSQKGKSTMKVTLISHTPDAAALLVFTKQARLGLTPERLADVAAWPQESPIFHFAFA